MNHLIIISLFFKSFSHQFTLESEWLQVSLDLQNFPCTFFGQSAGAVEYTDCRGVRLTQRVSWI